MESLGNAGKHQRQGNGKCSGAQIVHNGLAASTEPTFLISPMEITPGSDGEQHNGNDDKFQQVQENGPKGLNVGFRQTPHRLVQPSGSDRQ